MDCKKRTPTHIKQIKTSVVFLLLITFVIACEKMEEPASITTYKEVGVIKDLKGFTKQNDVYLTWGVPESKDFSEKAIKGFMIFISKVPERVGVEESGCKYYPYRFILASSSPDKSVDNLKSTYECIHKNAIRDDRTYLYKVVVMDKYNRVGKDSNIVSLKKGEN